MADNAVFVQPEIDRLISNDENRLPTISYFMDKRQYTTTTTTTRFGGTNNENENDDYDYHYLVQFKTIQFVYYPTMHRAEVNAMTEALRSNDHVQSLNLEDSIRDPSLLDPFLGTVLPTRVPTLMRLDLSSCAIGNGTRLIGEALSMNTTLQYLNLCRNRIGPAGVQSLVEGLHSNRTLKVLDLSDNETIGDQGAQIIASALPHDTIAIAALYLHHCDISDQGMKLIAKGLRKNKALKLLDVSFNRITNVGWACLADESLRHNSTLRVLRILFSSSTPFVSDTGASFIADVLRYTNHSLERLDLTGNYSVSPEIRNQINELCRENVRLKGTFQNIQDNVSRIPLCIWSKVLESVQSKPDYIYATLKLKPEVCRERSNPRRRRRRRPDRLHY